MNATTELAGAVLLGLLLFLAGIFMGFGYEEHRVALREARQAQLDAQTREAWIAHETANDAQVSARYEQQIHALQIDALQPVTPVRLCLPTGAVQTHPTAAVTPRVSEKAAAADNSTVLLDRVTAGPDVGPGVRDIAQLAERLTYQVEALQGAR